MAGMATDAQSTAVSFVSFIRSSRFLNRYSYSYNVIDLSINQSFLLSAPAAKDLIGAGNRAIPRVLKGQLTPMLQRRNPTHRLVVPANSAARADWVSADANMGPVRESLPRIRHSRTQADGGRHGIAS
jgi:hypothetical protein